MQTPSKTHRGRRGFFVYRSMEHAWSRFVEMVMVLTSIVLFVLVVCSGLEVNVTDVDCLILGAGMAGLMAGKRLQDRGWRVSIVDKGRGVAGRMATRRWDRATFDHGAQFFTARDPRFRRFVKAWVQQGVAVQWSDGLPGTNGAETVYRGEPTMTAICKFMAAQLPVQTATKIAVVQRDEHGWTLTDEQGGSYRSPRLLMTAPLPQCTALLEAGAVTLPATAADVLARISYDPCFAVMARLTGPSGIPAPGGQHCDGPILNFIADNFQKGISQTPCVTLHSRGEYARRHWDMDKEAIAEAMLTAALPWLKSAVQDWQVMKWKYSRPRVSHTDPCLEVPGDHPLVFAGDGFGGARVEGAALSGLAAAQTLLVSNS